MRQQILNLFTTPRDMSWEDILLNIVLAAVLGFFIFLSYAISHRGTIYSRKFNASLVILAVLTGTVMTVIGNNIALSLGMVGALSIVRFRTAIKDSRDTVYIFWSIIVGICCGVGDYAVACIGSAVTFAVILLLGCIKSDNRMLLIIRAHRSKQEPIKAQVYKLFRAKATLRVENTTEDTVELMYGDNVFEKDGIRRDRTGDGEKTRCLCGKRGIFNRDGPAMGPQIIRQLE